VLHDLICLSNFIIIISEISEYGGTDGRNGELRGINERLERYYTARL
jgi:hypothetical protein